MSNIMTATPALFRDRDLFVHDGAHLRRIRLSAPIQALFFFALLALVGWSGYAAARLVTPVPVRTARVTISSDIASLAAATEARVQQIEQRQKILAAMIAGEKVNPDVIAQLGYSLPAPGQEGRGGPFNSSSRTDPTFKSLFMSWKKLDNLAGGAIAIPADKPVKSAIFMSKFGLRQDPFENRRKNHEGIDLAAPLGTPIYATADGLVSTGYNRGGYGKFIRLNHGRGIETLYGHLSAISVQSGQSVTRGQEIGRMGSTGRSTGSHLHYEVRIDGNAVNPIPFMKSTDYLVAIQRKAGGGMPMDSVGMGGPQR